MESGLWVPLDSVSLNQANAIPQIAIKLRNLASALGLLLAFDP